MGDYTGMAAIITAAQLRNNAHNCRASGSLTYALVELYRRLALLILGRRNAILHVLSYTTTSR